MSKWGEYMGREGWKEYLCKDCGPMVEAKIAGLEARIVEYAKAMYQAGLLSGKLMVRAEKAEAECMEGHRAFESLFGEVMNGRSFATKLEMARRARDEIRTEIEQLRNGLAGCKRAASELIKVNGELHAEIRRLKALVNSSRPAHTPVVTKGDSMTDKAKAVRAFEKRKKNPPKRINNADLHAGSPMYFYCKFCGHESDVLPEEYTGKAEKVCGKCQDMVDMGWLEEEQSA